LEIKRPIRKRKEGVNSSLYGTNGLFVKVDVHDLPNGKAVYHVQPLETRRAWEKVMRVCIVD
jgi:hypothetical protein